MQNIDSKTCASRSITRDIPKLIRKGELNRSKLLDLYRHRKLEWSNSESQALDPGSKTLKSMHSILQIGVVFRVGGKVAVFSRPPKEKDDVGKITGGCSVLKSWSPKSFDPDDLSVDLAKKVHLDAGPALKWKERGLATTDIFDSQTAISPHYLFLIYEIELEDECRLSTKAHPNPKKNTEHHVDWFDPQEYHASSFQAQYFDSILGKRRMVQFDGAIDQLVLNSLKRGDMVDLEGTSRGLEHYFPATNVACDTEEVRFPTGEVEFDEHMKSLLRIIQAIRDKSGRSDMDITLSDIILFQPNFCGMGIDVVALFRFLKQFFRGKTELG